MRRLINCLTLSYTNAGIKFWNRKGLLREESKVFALWREISAEECVFGPECLRENAVFVRNALSAGVQPGLPIFDKFLRVVDLTHGVQAARSVLVLKRVEGLLCSPDVADPLWYKAKVAPDFVELWNQPMPPNIGGLQKNVVDCIEQWNEYASYQGLRYGLISTYMWTWAVCTDGANNVYVSPAFCYNAREPMVLEVVDYIIHQALSTDGICAPWEPLPHHLPSLLRSEGPASRTRSRTASQQTPPSNRAEASSDSGLDVDLLPGSTSAQGKAAMRLARAAAAFERDWVMGFLGAGALGEVLWGRMPCGRKVALKVAACGYRKEEMLRNEAKAYLAVQHLWNKGVPELLLAGELRAVGGSYGLGTSVLPGRPLQPGDAELLPAALAILKQIHSKGVIHGDLRPENFMAMEPDVAKGCADKTIFVLDFTHCTFDKRKKTQRSEICNLQSLFESL